MEQVYIFMLFTLFVLAIIDLVVGVSNDAVNFLNSAIGSKAVSLRTIMIVASVGVAMGAIFSSGMMEIARSGIFKPSEFYFDEIMVIFMAVMLTDVLLLDLFNSLGMPTSTTVSIVFELLGAAVCMALLKVSANAESLSDIYNYINTEKASEIIFGIFISVLIAFTVGTVVQYLARLIFTFRFEKNIHITGGIFGGISLTALSYFIIFKGLKGVSFITPEMLSWLDSNTKWLLIGCLVVFTILSQVLIRLRINIFKIVIIIGTFGLAMAFAGNDLVNFIGVPIAAWQSYEVWSASGLAPNEFTMESLGGKVTTPTYMLLAAGVVMVLTLWFSKKARAVIDTGVNLSRQGEGEEKFASNTLSRFVVRASVNLVSLTNKVIPQSVSQRIDNRFQKPELTRAQRETEPAFDLVRAAVNLVVASSLISLGTSLKLPLSTTYVAFMVAMGSSLADRAWGLESAVYRVAGVFNVIGGWFLTAAVAFVSAFLVALFLYFGKFIALVLLVIVVALLLFRSSVAFKNKEKEKKLKRSFEHTDLVTINEIIKESSDYIAVMIGKIDDLYGKVIDNLGTQELAKLTKNKKSLKKIENEIDDLKGNVYYFIKSLDESSVASSKFYILILDYLQDMVQSIGYITTNSHEHVSNNHKNLKFNQLRDLKGISDNLEKLFKESKIVFEKENYSNLDKIIDEERELKKDVSAMIQKQIDRIRTTETSPKNTKLYFSLLLETNDLIRANINLLVLFQEFQNEYKKLNKR
ncbi:MAG: inorganic phosphate transporter [Capnocytophaga sp.]|nr:inorganic phosphate transporter [Capnocytophaga sp.]